MPPYSRLTEFIVGQYREIAESPTASNRQKLEALKALKELRPNRRLGRKRSNQNKLLGIGDTTAAPIETPKTDQGDCLLGIPATNVVEFVESSAVKTCTGGMIEVDERP